MKSLGYLYLHTIYGKIYSIIHSIDIMKATTLTALVLSLAACSSLPITTTPKKTKPIFAPNTPTKERIAYIANQEHQAWGLAFIDLNGHLRRYSTTEGEHQRLADGQIAWQKVMTYWQDSKALETLDYHQKNCLKKPYGKYHACRYFALDVAWSAAFISYVMTQADVPDFTPSARHFDYIYKAWQGQGAYTFTDPSHTPVALGDMLCYLRGQKHMVGYQNLTKYLGEHRQWLPAHCDIVVKVTASETWLIGGNIANMVMLRKLPIDHAGVVITPKPLGSDEQCSPQQEAFCQLNRQNWSVLLKLKDD